MTEQRYVSARRSIAPLFKASKVRKSVDALKSHDIQLAESVAQTEQEVDTMYFGFLDKLVQDAKATSGCTISSVLTVRYLERIADHATYVAEAVVYICIGKKLILG